LEEIHHSPLLVKISPMIAGVIAILLSYILYVKKTDLPAKIANKLQIFYKISFNKWYFDEIYEVIFVKPTKKIGDFLWRLVDIKIVDGGPNGMVSFCKIMSNKVSKIQTGYIYNYALWMVLGIIIAAFFLISSFKQLMLL
jgi:NADH-quinone oxidoreductase subunit L